MQMNTVYSQALRGGAQLKLRRVAPMDDVQLQQLIAQLSPGDRRWRFHGAVNGLTPARIHAMTHPGPDTVALVATVNGELVADVRCVVDATGTAAEFALMVASGWRRRGLAMHCIEALCKASADAGWRWLYGTVMHDNAPMLALMLRCGFFCMPSRADPRLQIVERLLEPSSPTR